MATAVKVKTFPDLSRAFVPGLAVWVLLLSGLMPASAQEQVVDGNRDAVSVAEAGEGGGEGASKPGDEEKQEAAKKKSRIGMVIESTAAGAKVYTAIPGGKATVLAAAREWEYGLKLFSDAEWRELGMAVEDFYSAAKATADVVADEMKPVFQRDSRGVIEYALVKSEDVFLTSAIISSRFLARFRQQLGDELRVVAVDRHILYVFPALGDKLKAYGPAIAEIYRTTLFPGSLEVFQVSEEGFRVVGAIDF